jgi:hypothetical protein
MPLSGDCEIFPYFHGSLAELIDEVSDSWLTKELEELDEDGSL